LSKIADRVPLSATRTYDADSLIDTLNQRAINSGDPANSQPQGDRAIAISCYCERNPVERFFNKFKHYRPSPQYDQTRSKFFSPQYSWSKLSSCSLRKALIKDWLEWGAS